MRTARSRTKALVLYGILLGLPAAALVVVLWGQLRLDDRRDRDGVAAAVRFKAELVAEGMRSRLDQFLEAEHLRRPEQFGEWLRPRADEPLGGDRVLRLEPSPLRAEALPAGLRARFFGERQALLDAREIPTGLAPEQAWWFRAGPTPGGEPEPGLRAAVFAWFEDWYAQSGELRMSRSMVESDTPDSILRIRLLDLALLRAQLRSYGSQPNPGRPADRAYLLESLGPHAVDLSHLEHELLYSTPWCSLAPGPEGEPVALHTRVVRYRKETIETLDGASESAVGFANAPAISLSYEPRTLALENMAGMQGWVLDLDWLLGEVLEEVAAERLGPDEALVLASAPSDLPPDHRVELRLLERLEFEHAERYPELGRYSVTLSEAALQSRARDRLVRFLAAAGMLLLSFSTGLYFLLSGVNRELEAADRVQNFVSAVTHELRTPVSTIALHTELLQENWVSGPEQRDEYYARIAAEAERLAELVERVLRKARLGSGQTPAEEQPVESDLSERVEAASRRILAKRDDDVRFELARDLPPALLTAESVESIVENLVENARKYAPVEPGGEPILVRTRAADGQVLLEVGDRGEGIPKRQAARIFEAFYRVGSERTRSAKGTGLGLHLVQLQAEALGGRARVVEREGGGALFRVAFPAARGAREA